MLLIVFGLPGAGKTYIGNILKEEFGFYFFDGDDELTAEMKQAIKEKRVFTDSMRNIFFQKLINKISQLKKGKKKLVVTQTFIKEKYRNLFLKAFHNVIFILVQTKAALREKRLLHRNDLDMDYVKKMSKIFEKPTIQYYKIDNNTFGKILVIKELKKILFKQMVNY